MRKSPYIAFPKIGEGGPPGFPEASVAELWGFAMAVDEDDHFEFLIPNFEFPFHFEFRIPNFEFSLCIVHKNARCGVLNFGRVLYLLFRQDVV